MIEGNGSVVMPPRLSVRRFFLCLVCCGGALLILGIYHHHSYLLNELVSDVSSVTAASVKGGAINPIQQHQQHQQLATWQENVQTEEPIQAIYTKKKAKHWYFAGGTEYPEKTNTPAVLFPHEGPGDRIVEQLMHIPPDYEGYDSPEKVILAYNGLGQWDKKAGPGAFHGCPVNRCSLTDDKTRAAVADAIIYKDHFSHPAVPRPRHQVWMLYFLECPYHTQSVKYSDMFNWTATYRRDSTLVAPYERWTYYDPQVRQKSQLINYASNKTKKVAWFVSNCGSRNGRLAYARELAKHISVDIYGTCGPLRCPRHDKACFDILDKEYKFYLAFENSNCRDYITEKLYVNGLSHSVLPIVMGARPEDYERSAPEGSYIHVDEFASPAELAAYLHRLDKDDHLYNSYFKWKDTGEFINTYFWCRLCTLLHSSPQNTHYEDVNEWWRGSGVCTQKSWRHMDGG